MTVPAQLILLAAETAQHGADAVEAVEQHSEATGGIASLGIDPLAILFQAGTFVVLFVLLRKFAFKKIVSMLDERHETIERGLADAQKIQAQLEETTVAQEAALKEARVQADIIIAKAHEEAGAMMKSSEDAVAKKTEKMIADAEAKTAADIAKAKRELRGEMLALVAQATETVIGVKLDAQKDAQLLEKALAGDK